MNIKMIIARRRTWVALALLVALAVDPAQGQNLVATPAVPEPGPAGGATPATIRTPAADWTNQMRGFTIVGRRTGYLGADEFLQFLDESAAGARITESHFQRWMAQGGFWTLLAVLLVVAGGLGLNLTPCVLPLIPVNIAVLGAGTRSGSRARGFLLGSVYGMAMALAYGVLGVAVVITGSKFGMLNSSPLFNALAAVVFLALALAMFDVFFLDFSRWQGSRPAPAGSSGHVFIAAFIMGSLAALLAGSCVSPILVSVLLWSADLYGRGENIGLVLPFLLGLGMGLPWPFLGAGLSFLPPPGKWMVYVKRVFGIVILGFAVHYGLLAWRLYRERAPESKARVEHAQQARLKTGWHTSLPEALAEARRDNQPVFVDLWASWCNFCLAMDETTFRDPRVVKRLEAYVKVKYRADDLDDPQVRNTLDYFGSIGLPTYIILQPVQTPRVR